jgi:hypothetical protein
MTDAAQGAFSGEDAASLARSLRRVGWIGFWTQIVVAVAPVLAVVLVIGAVRGFAAPGARFDVLGWLSMMSFAVLIFTTWWSWRYTGLAQRLAAGEAAPTRPELTRAAWIGLGASGLGILFSIIVMTAEVIYLLVVFLEAPQGGAPVFQTIDGGGPSWLSAIDMLGLLTLILTIAAEIFVLLLGLWLLFRLTGRTPDAIGRIVGD